MNPRRRRREILQKSQYELQRKKKRNELNQEQSITISQPGMEEDNDEDYEDVDEDGVPDTDIEDEEEDEYEEEEIADDDDDQEPEPQEPQQFQEAPKPALKRKKEFEQKPAPEKRAWFNDGIQEEHLDFDNKAYNMLHRVNTEWPCLSCDIVLPPEEQQLWKTKQMRTMDKYPYTIYLAAGTQAGQPSKNQLYLMKLSKMHKTKYDDESDREDPEDGDIMNDEEGEIHMQSVVGLKNGVNRIRTMNYQPIVAYWSENGDVVIANLRPLYDVIDSEKKAHNINQLQHRSFANPQEGFALDWNPLQTGQLVTGSMDGKIFTYAPKDEIVSDYARDSSPYVYHHESVEDLQWSPIEPFAFASCSVDGTLQVCDTRVGNRSKSQIMIEAHKCDVNVLTWNGVATNLIATGADDGSFKVWDLRYPAKESISDIVWHNKQITSIQFQPGSDTTLAVASADNKLTIWDFAVENDEQEQDVPDQLMFVHQGQTDLKELRYHPVYNEMIVSTAASGFNVFKATLDQALSESSQSEDDEKGEIPQIHEKDLDAYLSKLSLE